MNAPQSTDPVRRWRCTSYCRCTPLSEQHGHFEQHRLGVWVLHSDVERMERELEQLRLDLAQHNGNATAVLQAQHERDCAVEDVKRLSDALQVLLDEQNDAPLERRRAEWQRACDNARSALRVDVSDNSTEKTK